MKITLTAAEAVELTQLQSETIAAREQFQALSEQFQESMTKVLNRSKYDAEEYKGRQFLVKVEKPNVYLECIDIDESSPDP